MSDKRGVDFKRLTRHMDKDALVAEDWPTVVGGSCAEKDLKAWLNELDISAMPVRIWSFTDRSIIGTDGPPQTVAYLERARLFGIGGDLELRRDGRQFRWRYVGDASHAPEGKSLAYAGTDHLSPVYRREREALLWGTREGSQDRWFDDRVAGARLTYLTETPALGDGVEERVKILFWEYTQAGRPIAVWLRQLERIKEDKNG